MLWLAAYLTGFPPAGLYTLCWTHGQALDASWIQRMNEAGLTRSMSKKGCSPDNSACEGFFGRMKNEMFYGEKWDKISVEEFISIINQYMQWYRDKRIKLSLGGLSPMEYRRSLGIA